MPKPIVIKSGGHQISDPEFLSGLAKIVANLEEPAVLVHGGGKEISELQEKLGIVPRYADGLRITDEESLAVVQMVLCGLVNKRLVSCLVEEGVDALGLCGADRGMIRAEKAHHPTIDMQYTGEVSSVDSAVLLGFIEQGIVPVIAPVCLGDGSLLNVNADHVAGAVAEAIDAQQVVFVTNVEGVLLNGSPVPKLSVSQTKQMIADGTISGGMIPKVQTALQMLNANIPESIITNLEGLSNHAGTIFVKDEELLV